MTETDGNRQLSDERTQWHPAFCSAMRLELRGNKGDLDYSIEYNLGSKPLQIDLPVGLLAELEKRGMTVGEQERGIYYVENPWFPMQVVVTGHV